MSDDMAGARQILSLGNDGHFTVHSDNLGSILLQDDVIDKPVVLISVAGAFRKGKSFLLDMMLRYLTASGKEDWIDTKHSDSAGLPWKSGHKQHTTGILMWSSPFPVTLPSGNEAIILLMETQGTFDNQSTMHESATVFALSTLLSSLQVFNLMGNLQNDDLEHLQLFTEYGRMAMDDGNGTPFQKLMFLVRDWQYVEDLPLGAQGGDELVNEWLHDASGKKELQKVRNHIRDCFTHIRGFLLPYPGQAVATSPKFNGKSEDMDSRFVDGLRQLMPILLSPENLTIRTVAGNPMKARDLANFIEMYVDLFKGDKLPKPMSILNATAEANNMAAVQESKSQYIKHMENVLGGDRPSLDKHDVFRHHEEAARQAEAAFRNRKKMGDWKTSEVYHIQLTKEMEEWFKFAEQANNAKREKERLNAESHNMILVRTCKAIYGENMQGVSGDGVGHVSLQEMEMAHSNAKQKALKHYDEQKIDFEGIAKDIRFQLVENIDSERRQLFVHNDKKKDPKNQKAAEANMKAVGHAKQNYQMMMNTLTADQALSEDELRKRHQKCLRSAVEVFDILKDGDEKLCSAYLENMKCDIEQELDTYIRSNKLNAEMSEIKRKLEELQKVSNEERNNKTPESRCVVM